MRLLSTIIVLGSVSCAHAPPQISIQAGFKNARLENLEPINTRVQRSDLGSVFVPFSAPLTWQVKNEVQVRFRVRSSVRLARIWLSYNGKRRQLSPNEWRSERWRSGIYALQVATQSAQSITPGAVQIEFEEPGKQPKPAVAAKPAPPKAAESPYQKTIGMKVHALDPN